jgi:hypothetical protein
MPNWTVTQRAKADVWTSQQGGQMQSWDLVLVDGERTAQCQANTKLGNEFPEVGQQVEGELVNRGPDRPMGFKKAYNPQQGKSPAESRQIARMAAQKAAVALLKVEIETGLLKPEAAKASELLTPRIDYFFNDILKAGESA